MEDIGETAKRLLGWDSPVYDMFMSAVFGRKVLDLFAFDDWLHEKYGIYEDRDMSMQQLIEQEYGEEAEQFVRTAFNV